MQGSLNGIMIYEKKRDTKERSNIIGLLLDDRC